MYLHLGFDCLVEKENIIGIFDIETTTVSQKARKFLKKAEKNGAIFQISEQLPKSFIIAYNEKPTVYLSPLASSTLKKRNNNKNII